MSRDHLFLVRHGETVHNVARIAQGWQDSELSEHGQMQVEKLAQRLAAYRPDALYSSSLGRALTTAEAIANATGLEVQPLDDLREMNYGNWEGKSFLDVRRDDRALYEQWVEDADAPCPEGESHNDVRRRITRALESVEGARPILVTHGTAIRVAVTALLDIDVMHARSFAQDNAALNLFLWRGERWVMKLWNDSTHWGAP